MTRTPQDADGAKQKGTRKPFCIRVVRLLTKAAIATELGPEVCWLLTVIATTQDARHYSGMANYWNEPLMTLCGFNSKGRLVRARNKAIESGWLEYLPGGKGKVGRYRVLIPEELAHIPDGPTDEGGDDCEGLPFVSGSKIERETDDNRTTNGREADDNRTANGPLSTYTVTETVSSCSEPSQVKDSKPETAAPGFASFPVVGKGKTWNLPAVKLTEWQDTYTHLDVAAELRKARQWLIDNPSKRKTARGIVRFLNAWLTRAQDSGRGARRNGTGGTPESIYKPLRPLDDD